MYYNVYCDYFGVFIEKHVYIYQVSPLSVVGVIIMCIYVPIIMYGLRRLLVFYKLQCLPNCLHINLISSELWVSITSPSCLSTPSSF